MNKLLIISIAILANACTYSLYPTEQYIKTTIQEHIPGEYSQIKIFRLFTSKHHRFQKDHSIIEFSACKYSGEKKLVIASERYVSRKGVIVSDYDFVVLNESQIEELEKGFKTAYSGLRKENKKLDELSYYDFTSTDSLFISVVNTNTSSATVQFWVKGHKHEILAMEMKKILLRFRRY